MLQFSAGLEETAVASSATATYRDTEIPENQNISTRCVLKQWISVGTCWVVLLLRDRFDREQRVFSLSHGRVDFRSGLFPYLLSLIEAR
jgi:hypothetical protein